MKSKARSLILLPLLLSGGTLSGGCASFFSRSNPEAENAAKREKNSYSAIEEPENADLKDKKIHHLQTTVSGLNSRIQDLEGKLEASQSKPNYSAASSPNEKSRARQSIDGGAVRATTAGNDPGAGFVNDASVRGFQQGKILFDQEKFPESILAFSAFLEMNPSHPLASSAQYYIGENYYRQSDYTVADQEFQKLAVRYPQSSRVSYALVRLSQSSAMLGKTEEARRYRIQAEGLFPKSPALKLLRETPTASDAANSVTPIATAPERVSDMLIEKPSVPAITTPQIETPQIEAPRVEMPQVQSPMRRAADDLDGPPGGGG